MKYHNKYFFLSLPRNGEVSLDVTQYTYGRVQLNVEIDHEYVGVSVSVLYWGITFGICL